MSEGRYIDRAELLNRLATVNTEDWEYRAKVYTIIGELEGKQIKEEKDG